MPTVRLGSRTRSTARKDKEGDAQEKMQMQQQRWPWRPPSSPAHLRSAAVSLLQNHVHIVFDPALAKIRSGRMNMSEENQASIASAC